VLGGLGAAPAQANSAASNAAGAVEALRGEGYAVAAAERRRLQPAAAVFVGDLIGTQVESAMRVRLGTATQVRLGPEARLKIDRFILNAGGELFLEKGGVLVDHPPGAGRIELDLRSPFGLVAVRGTRFFAGPSNGVFGVFVARGAVTVSGGGQAVHLREGQGTDIRGPGAPPGDAVPWGEARVRAALRLVGAD
jgi:hypothetical protein